MDCLISRREEGCSIPEVIHTDVERPRGEGDSGRTGILSGTGGERSSIYNIFPVSGRPQDLIPSISPGLIPTIGVTLLCARRVTEECGVDCTSDWADNIDGQALPEERPAESPVHENLVEAPAISPVTMMMPQNVRLITPDRQILPEPS